MTETRAHPQVAGWRTLDGPAAEPRSFARPDDAGLAALIAREAEPLPDPDDPAFGALFDRFADSRVVLLGEASHGTSEFYRARAEITRRLVERHGFDIVALEADWPDAACLNRYVRGQHARPGADPPFQRFPTWMWRNREMAAFTDALRAWNLGRPEARRCGVYGLDLYSLDRSMRAVIDYLDKADPAAAQAARARYGCLRPWAEDPARYGRVVLTAGHAKCEAAVLEMLGDVLARDLNEADDPEGVLGLVQNARLVANAEAYYRVMYYGSAESWNLRDTHMFETLRHVLDAKGPQSKAVVWAHNSHIGDAAFTGMGVEQGELNIGQLCREHFGTAATRIGFGTHAGTVACASDWDAPMKTETVRPSRPDSHERLAHDSGLPRFLLELRGREDLQAALVEPRLQRFIGVIYRPETERWSHYVACQLPWQYDAYVWFDETQAVTPLAGPEQPGADETWPFGL
jgi:erythromycin esterase-like protein